MYDDGINKGELKGGGGSGSGRAAVCINALSNKLCDEFQDNRNSTSRGRHKKVTITVSKARFVSVIRRH